MIDKIIKALEKSLSIRDSSFKEYLGDVFEQSYIDCLISPLILRDTIDLINRQKSEIETLKGWDRLLKAESHAPIIKKAKSEAITEFAEMAKEATYHYYDSDIDQIAKKLKGGGTDA